MFLFSGRGYWQELIESIVWAHSKIGLNPVIEPRALSLASGRAVDLALCNKSMKKNLQNF